jgi:hypothetical protein
MSWLFVRGGWIRGGLIARFPDGLGRFWIRTSWRLVVEMDWKIFSIHEFKFLKVLTLCLLLLLWGSLWMLF